MKRSNSLLKALLGVFAIVSSLGACVTPATVGATPTVKVPPDSAYQCQAHCGSMGLTLDAVVVMASEVGCVCRPMAPPMAMPPAAPPPAASAPAARAGSSAGGMAAVMMARAAAERARQSSDSYRRRQQQSQSYSPRR